MEHALDRGEMKHKDRARQLLMFSGMIRRRGITPTDLDGIIDYNGKAFILFEGKQQGAPFLKGQKLALENIIDVMFSAKIEAILILFTHTVPIEEDVKVSGQNVIMYYYEQAWRVPKEPISVLEAVEMFEKHCESKGIDI